MMSPEDLLVGPRGRRLCYEVATADRAEVGLPIALHGLREACTSARYWQEPDGTDVALTGRQWEERLRGVAEQLAGDPVTAEWDAPVDRADQHLVDYPEDTSGATARPVLTGLEHPVRALAEEHARSRVDDPAIDWRTVSGIWWSAPIARPGAATTRSTGAQRVPLGLLCVEDAFDWAVADSWRVLPASGAGVFELDSPAAWVELVRRYPLDVTATTKRSDWWKATGRDGSWVMPDWPAVADDWDGVHLSVTGYLATAGRALDVDAHAATVLAGWPPDATFWLRDVLRPGAGPIRWQQDEDGDWARTSP